MTKNKLIRLVAVCTACLSMSVFAFSGCKKKTAASTGGDNTITIPDDETPKTDGPDIIGGDNTDKENPGDNTGSGNEDGDNTGTENPGDNTGTENPGDNTGGGTETPPDTDPGDGDNTGTENPGDNTDTGNGDGGNTGTENPGGDTGNEGGTTTPPTDPDEGVKDPIISEVTNGPKITKSSKNELETAYVEWTAAENAKWYNVYYSVADANDWKKLDGPLVRKYSTYYRADMVGLKAGEYDMKVVPVSDDGNEAAEYAAISSGITVRAQTREGYAFTGGNVPGAYNMDGTLKSGAQVVYVTANNAKTVTATVNGVQVTGFQSIIDARNKGVTDPICFRIVGTVNRSDLDHISSSSEGLQIKGKGASTPTENITIEGVGNDGTINGFGMLIRYCKNVEIRNLGLVNFMDDGVSIDTGNSHLWVHNLDIFYGSAGGDSDQAKGDGSLDSKGSDYCTYSYNHFWDSGKCNLLGNGSSESSGEGGATHLTYHHNWYDHSDSRHPRIRIATVHVYNNYFDGNSKYGVGVTMGASAFVESNYYRSTATMKPMMSSLQGTDIAHGKDGQTFSGEAGGMIKAYGNAFVGKYELLTQHDTEEDNLDCYLASSRDEIVPNTYKTKSGGTTYNNFDTASDFYKYEADSAEQAKLNVERYAGRVDGGDLKWEFDDVTEDPNYAIIPGLKAAVTNYKSSVLQIGDAVVGGGSNEGGSTGGDSGNEGGETGGENPDTPDTPPTTVEGEITFIPKASGNGFTVTGTAKSHSAITVAGVEIAKNSALKLNSSGKVTFSTTEDMTITLYVLNGNTIKVDGVEKSVTAEEGYYVVSFTLSSGEHTIEKGGSENSLYMIKLTPVA